MIAFTLVCFYKTCFLLRGKIVRECVKVWEAVTNDEMNRKWIVHRGGMEWEGRKEINFNGKKENTIHEIEINVCMLQDDVEL